MLHISAHLTLKGWLMHLQCPVIYLQRIDIMWKIGKDPKDHIKQRQRNDIRKIKDNDTNYSRFIMHNKNVPKRQWRRSDWKRQ